MSKSKKYVLFNNNDVVKLTFSGVNNSIIEQLKKLDKRDIIKIFDPTNNILIKNAKTTVDNDKLTKVKIINNSDFQTQREIAITHQLTFFEEGYKLEDYEYI